MVPNSDSPQIPYHINFLLLHLQSDKTHEQPWERTAKTLYEDGISRFQRGELETLQEATNLFWTTMIDFFDLFEEYNLVIKTSKTFIGYPSVALLGQKVDSLGLSTAEEKLAANGIDHVMMHLK